MAQHDYVIANGSGSAVRADLNDALAAIVSLNSGTSEPTDTFAYMLWADTTAGVLKIRNAANNAWITLRELDGTLTIEGGSASTPGLYFTGDANTGIYSPGADQFAIATNGVERVEWGTSEVVFNDGGGNYDFRIEGDTDTDLFFVDASADTVAIAGITHPTADGTAGQVISTDGSGALSFVNPGKVIKVQHYTDAGGTTTSSSLVDANTAAFSFTPLSASSTLILQFSFQAQQVAVAAVNVATSHRIHEGATGLGSTYSHGAASGSGGLALTSIAFIQVSIASTGTSARSFTLRHATNNASGPAGSTLIKATIMEVAS
jgi:hypothetical protein